MTKTLQCAINNANDDTLQSNDTGYDGASHQYKDSTVTALHNATATNVIDHIDVTYHELLIMIYSYIIKKHKNLVTNLLPLPTDTTSPK